MRLKAIAKEPKDRYATMAEFAGALEDFLAANPARYLVRGHPSRPTRALIAWPPRSSRG